MCDLCKCCMQRGSFRQLLPAPSVGGVLLAAAGPKVAAARALAAQHHPAQVAEVGGAAPARHVVVVACRVGMAAGAGRLM